MSVRAPLNARSDRAKPRVHTRALAKGPIATGCKTAERARVAGLNWKLGISYALEYNEDELSCVRVDAEGRLAGRSNLVFANEVKLVLRDASQLVCEGQS